MPSRSPILVRILSMHLVFGALACLQTAHALAAPSAGPYCWAEADGTLHISENLSDVAEPFLSIYRAGQVVQAAGRQAGGRVASGLEGDRAAWQARLATARQNLLTAVQAYAQTQQTNRAQRNQGNPILRLLPVDPERVAQGEQATAAAKARYLAAYKALTVTLPQSAKRAQVPAAWLQ